MFRFLCVSIRVQILWILSVCDNGGVCCWVYFDWSRVFFLNWPSFIGIVVPNERCLSLKLSEYRSNYAFKKTVIVTVLLSCGWHLFRAFRLTSLPIWVKFWNITPKFTPAINSLLKQPSQHSPKSINRALNIIKKI